MRYSFLFLFIFQCTLQSIKAQRAVITSDQKLAAHQKAVRLMNESFQAMGGTAKAKAIRTLALEWNGEKFMDGQSTAFDKALVSLPVQNRTIIDFEKDRLVNENVDRYLGGYLFHFRNVYGDSSAFSFEIPKLRFSGVSELALTSKATVKQQLLRAIPIFLLANAAEKKQTYRYVGEITDAKGVLDVISFAYTPNLAIDIHLDRKTHLPARYTFYTDHAVHGDQMITCEFDDYRNVDGFLFPYQRKFKANDVLIRQESVTSLEINKPIPSELFDRPQGYGKAIVMERRLTEIGKNIFMLEGLNGYNPLVLNFSDHLMIVEAVGGSEEAIQAAKEKFPDKPIKYIALSHYHEDHSAGLPAFINKGITVITSKANEKYVQHTATALHSVIPGEKYLGAIQIQTVDSLTVNDSNLSFRMINAGKNSHCDDMFMFYFPQQKILYQADMLISTDEGKISYPLIPLNYELYEIIKKKKLDVETIYGVHWKKIAFKELEDAVVKNKK